MLNLDSAWPSRPSERPSGRLPAREAALVALGVAAAAAVLSLQAHLSPGSPPPPPPSLVRYEDGSGVLYQGDKEVATYPADTFVWHCDTMGNRICGDIDDADLSAS